MSYDSRLAHIGLLLPLCTSSATVGLALFQYPIFSAFFQATTQQGTQSLAGQPFSKLWESIASSGTAVVASLFITSATAGALSARWLQTHATLETTAVSKWYAAGAAFAAGHAAFVPLIVPIVKRIVENGKEGSGKVGGEVEKANKEEVKSWFVVHTVRTLVVDLPALVCFAYGATQCFWVI